MKNVLWKTPEYFDTFDQSILEEREGCAVFLKKTGDDAYEGSTHEKDCKSTLRGASYATSIVKVEQEKITSWDQGFDADDKQVWGATLGGYIFEKLKTRSQMEIKYYYSDGSGNGYKLIGNELAYDPITREESSSGTYDGGEKKKIEISTEAQKEIADAFQKAFESKSSHSERREKGTGIIKIVSEGKVQSCILKYRSAERQEIQGIMDRLLER